MLMPLACYVILGIPEDIALGKLSKGGAQQGFRAFYQSFKPSCQ